MKNQNNETSVQVATLQKAANLVYEAYELWKPQLGLPSYHLPGMLHTCYLMANVGDEIYATMRGAIADELDRVISQCEFYQMDSEIESKLCDAWQLLNPDADYSDYDNANERLAREEHAMAMLRRDAHALESDTLDLSLGNYDEGLSEYRDYLRGLSDDELLDEIANRHMNYRDHDRNDEMRLAVWHEIRYDAANRERSRRTNDNDTSAALGVQS